MRKFCKFISPSVRDDTFFESCGVADLIASSYGGRNRRVAEAWAQKRIAGDDQVTFEKLEKVGRLGVQELRYSALAPGKPRPGRGMLVIIGRI
eukprot:scaffold47949_cov21-Tisochrysis_lutea.AAC.4